MKKRKLCLADGYVPTAGEQEMLKSFNNRMGIAADTTGGTPVGMASTAPISAGLRGTSMQQKFSADDRAQQKAQDAMMSKVNDQLSSLSSMQGLSDRQRASAAASIAGDAAKFGLSPDISSFTGSAGLSQRQKLGLSTQALGQQAQLIGFDQQQQEKRNSREYALDNNAYSALGFKDGKVPVHEGPGVVKGPGGPRDDKVPAMLSNKEAVLPAATVTALGGPEAVEELIENTTGRSPHKGLREGGEYWLGLVGRGLASAKNLYTAAKPTLGVLGTVGTGVGAATGAAELADSTPSLRGQATAASTDMTLAGTPQHEEEVLGELNSRALNNNPDPRAKAKAVNEAIMEGSSTGDAKTIELPKIDKPAVTKTTSSANAKADPVSPAGLRAAQVHGDTEFSKSTGIDPELVAAARANDNRASFMGEKDATAYNVPQGFGGGVITGSPDKNGLRKTTLLLGPSAADAARDKEFEAKGYGKDVYGNWITPQYLGMKQQLAQLQHENMMSNLSSSNPAERRNAVLQLGLRMSQESAAAKAAQDRQKMLMDLAKFDQDERRINADFGLRREDAKLKRSDAVGKAIEALSGGDKQLQAEMLMAGQAYADDPNLSPAQVAARNSAIPRSAEKALNDRASHMFSLEQDNDGKAPARWRKDPGGKTLWDAVARGMWMGHGDIYEDPATGRRISEKQLSGMSPYIREYVLNNAEATKQANSKK